MNSVKIYIKYQNQVIKIHQFYHVIVLYLHKIRKLRIWNDLLKLMDLSIFTSVIWRLLAVVSSDEGLFFYILLYCIFLWELFIFLGGCYYQLGILLGLGFLGGIWWGLGLILELGGKDNQLFTENYSIWYNPTLILGISAKMSTLDQTPPQNNHPPHKNPIIPQKYQ